MSNDLEKRFRVVGAALQAFSRFGYRRASMADIASAAGVSRPSLYLIFPNKVAVFRSLAEMLLADAMSGAEAAWPEGMDVAEGMTAAILAKDLPIHQLLAATPHAAEILAEAETLAADLHADSKARFKALVAARLSPRDAGMPVADGEDDEEPEAEALARLVANATEGLKHAGLDEATYVADVKRLAALVAGAARP